MNKVDILREEKKTGQRNVNLRRFYNRRLILTGAGKRTTKRTCRPNKKKKSAKWVNGKCIRYGDPNMTIKKHIPSRKKAFCARHNCKAKHDPQTPGYQSCLAWKCKVGKKKHLSGGRAVQRKMHSPRNTKKNSSQKKTSGTATRTKPGLWNTCKHLACTKGKLCKHSARKMQYAVRCYKSKGGGYRGSSQGNSLRRWGKEKWRTYSGKKSGGKLRYLPSKAWKHLSPRQIRTTNAAKRRGYKQGKQFVRQPKDVARIAKRFRGTKKKD